MKWLLMALTLFLVSCDVVQEPKENEYINLGDPFDAMVWIASNITYRGETGSQDDWQLPSRTKRERAGDCEDTSILLASALLASGESGVWLVGYEKSNGKKHMVVEWANMLWESEYGYPTEIPAGAHVILRCTFEDALKVCK